MQNAIKQLIEARFDAVSGANGEPSDPEPTNHKRPATNGTSDVGSPNPSASPEPARKKAKRSSSVEDADAKLAAQLQAQENRLARGRSTRGGNDKKMIKKKAPRKKSAKKISANEDSDVDSGEAAPKRKAGGGFQKPFLLSPALSELCGETQVRVASWVSFLLYIPMLPPPSHRPLSFFFVRANNFASRSYHDPMSSRASGSTSKRTTSRILATNARFSVTRRCRLSSSRQRWICSK